MNTTFLPTQSISKKKKKKKDRMANEEKNPTGDPSLWKTICVSGGEMLIGRASAKHPERVAKKSNMLFENSHLSKVHAKLLIINKVLYLEDLSSTFGTIWNNHLLIPHKKVAICEGDRIGFVLNKPSTSIKNLTRNASGSAMVGLEILLNPLAQLVFSIVSFDAEEGSLVLLPLKGSNCLGDLRKETQARKLKTMSELKESEVVAVNSSPEKKQDIQQGVLFGSAEPHTLVILEAFKRHSNEDLLKFNKEKVVKFKDQSGDEVSKGTASPIVEVIESQSEDNSQKDTLKLVESNPGQKSHVQQPVNSRLLQDNANILTIGLDDSEISDLIEDPESSPEPYLSEDSHFETTKSLLEVVECLPGANKTEQDVSLDLSYSSEIENDNNGKSLGQSRENKLWIIEKNKEEHPNKSMMHNLVEAESIKQNDPTGYNEGFEEEGRMEIASDKDGSEIEDDDFDLSSNMDRSEIEDGNFEVASDLEETKKGEDLKIHFGICVLEEDAEEGVLSNLGSVTQAVHVEVAFEDDEDSAFDTLEYSCVESTSPSEDESADSFKNLAKELSNDGSNIFLKDSSIFADSEAIEVQQSEKSSSNPERVNSNAITEPESTVDYNTSQSKTSRKRTHDLIASEDDSCLQTQDDSEIPNPKKAKTRSLARELGKGLFYVTGTLVALVAYGGYLERSGQI